MTEEQAQRTGLLARALGPFLLLLALIIFARYETLPAVLPPFAQEAPLILVTGVFTLLFGCLMFAAHHHFNAPSAFAVSVLALIFIVRGISLALVPDLVIAMATQVARVPVIMLGVTTVFGLIGAWLTFVGWFAKRPA
jgi:uncharacterized protein YjeT (DUF2065 family)